ncbi:MAG: hypothetical protein J6A22_01900 [Bacteroidales bacterium]|nr:hypothetical protein [Bacteroidales bacterium]
MGLIRYMTLIGIVLQVLCSCRAISTFLKADEVVAEVGGVKLYRSDLVEVIPSGVHHEDSVRLAKQYINSWASDQVFLRIAEEQLSKNEKDVSIELEEYRKSLLKYRYEQLYVNERLDTAVSEDLIRQYHEDNQDKFILARPLVKARFLNIASDSPNMDPIRKLMTSSDVNDLYEADSLAYSSAIRFTAWGGEWVDASVLAREFGEDLSTLLASARNGWIERNDGDGYVKVAYVAERLEKGTVAPLEYCATKIKDIIISVRKQNLVVELEKQLLEDAVESGKFVIY